MGAEQGAEPDVAIKPASLVSSPLCVCKITEGMTKRQKPIQAGLKTFKIRL